MLKKLLFIFVFLQIGHNYAQSCPSLISPINGENNVPVDTSIIWNSVDGIPGYRVRLGTTPGGSEISEQSVGSATSYNPPLGLPENTTIYVTIVLDFLFQGSNDIVCSSQSFTTEDVIVPPNCTTFRNPQQGAINVSVFSNISWEYAATATGYRISIGTTTGNDDIVSNVDVGNTLTYNPPAQLPANNAIYVTLTPYNENGASTSNCIELMFTTGDIATLPSCTNLISPINGAIDVPLTPLIEWSPVAGATGYRVSIGSTPTNSDVLDNAVFTQNSTFVLDFEPNRTFFITIIPFNDSGEALSCGQQTFSTLLGCGPYLDVNTGEFITLNPEIDFPDSLSFCQNEVPFIFTSTDIVDGYRWYQLDQFGNETVVSETNQISLIENGVYRYEAYNLVSQNGNTIECSSTKDFTVVSSEIATINNLRIIDTALGLQIIVEASGNGDYEYAIDDINGPYQDSNTFNAVIPGTHTLYVRDKNGCGIAEETFMQDLTVEGFPKFFTPNGDSTNDFWQFVQPVSGDRVVLNSIRIYDRYGKFIKEITQDSQGWDGNYNGQPLPTGGYWFKAIDDMQREIQGFFTLKR